MQFLLDHAATTTHQQVPILLVACFALKFFTSMFNENKISRIVFLGSLKQDACWIGESNKINRVLWNEVQVTWVWKKGELNECEGTLSILVMGIALAPSFNSPTGIWKQLAQCLELRFHHCIFPFWGTCA